MDLLLDSHAALWWAEDPGLLEPTAGSAIANPSNSVWASAASAWELAIKVAAGKLVVDVRSLFLGLTLKVSGCSASGSKTVSMPAHSHGTTAIRSTGCSSSRRIAADSSS